MIIFLSFVKGNLMDVVIVYYRTPKLRTSILEDNEEIIRNSHYYFKFAAAAYGWKLMNGYMFDNKERIIVRGFMTGDQQNNNTLCEHTGIKPGHIVCDF